MTIDYKNEVDPDFAALAKFPSIDFDKKIVLALIKAYARVNWGFSKPRHGVTSEAFKLKTANTEYKVEYFKNPKLSGKRPCLVFYHGGGFALPALGYHKQYLSDYMNGAECDALFVDYSLAPKTRAHDILEECYGALEWLLEHAEQFDLDTDKIAVGGDSAGGALAASIAQRAFDSIGPNSICFQLLIYPVLDNQLKGTSIQTYFNAPVWSGKSCVAMWDTYLDSSGPCAYAVPMAREDLSGLAPAYIENAEFDPLRDEATAYADRLEQAGVTVSRHFAPKALHGYDTAFDSKITRGSVSKRIKALAAAFV